VAPEENGQTQAQEDDEEDRLGETAQIGLLTNRIAQTLEYAAYTGSLRLLVYVAKQEGRKANGNQDWH
jgi:hypothetical protein